MPLKVIIVGSGLAGLATASFLVQQGHDVTMYERSKSNIATGGQGIGMWSNGMRMLQRIGFDAQRAGGVVSGGWRSFDKHGNLQTDTEIDFESRFGIETMTMKREDLRKELLRIATDQEKRANIEKGQLRAVWNKNVVDVQADEGIVALEDGSVDKGDTVIVANGVHSHLRKCILGNDSHFPQKMGMTCYRVAVSVDAIRKITGELPPWLQPNGAGKGHINLIESGDCSEGIPRFITAYPISNYEAFNFSFLAPTPKSRQGVAESWYADANREEMIELFRDFDETFTKILLQAEELKVWDIQDLDPLPTFVKGRAILIGDAAHAMTVLQGQGANMAMEDAEAFTLLERDVRSEDVPGILQQIDSIRRPRTKQVLSDTREMVREMSIDERFAKMNFNMRYGGIAQALRNPKSEWIDVKQEGKANSKY